ncbi:MAG: hypothetical protein ABJZ55_16110 [Fuerstiella sp.]
MMFEGSTLNSETYLSDEIISLPDGTPVEITPPTGAGGYFMQIRPAGGTGAGIAFLRYGQAPDITARLGLVLVVDSPDGHWAGLETINIRKDHPFIQAVGLDAEAFIMWVA